MSFAPWLATDCARTILVEVGFAYESGGSPAEGTLYFSKSGGPGPYITSSTDTPANVAYRDVIRQAPSVVRAVPRELPAGNTTIEFGELVLDNADGSLDFMLDLVLDGRDVRVYLGDHRWVRADFGLVASAVAQSVRASGDDTIVVTLRDHRRLLNRDIAGDVVSDERRKPLIFCAAAAVNTGGACSIEPVEKSAANLQYYVLQNHAGAILQQVYDNGVELRPGSSLFTANNASLTADAGTDTLTRAAHGLVVNDVIEFRDGGLGVSTIFPGLALDTQYWVIPAGLTANDFRLSLTKGGPAINITGTTFSSTVAVRRYRAYDNLSVDGTIELSSVPVGRVVVDVAGRAPSQVSLNDGVAQVIAALLQDYGGIDASEIDAASFVAVDSTVAGNFQKAARAVLDRDNLLEVLDDLARTIQMFYGPDFEGVFRAGRLDLGSLAAATSAHELGEADLFEPPHVANAEVITGTIAVRSRMNHQPLSYGELAVAVSVEDKREFSSQYREMRESTAPTGTSYAGNWQSYHKTARREELAGAFATSAGDITGIADEILGDIKPHVKTIDVVTDLRPYDWNLGDVVTFTYPRYGFDAGQKCRVARIATDLGAESVSLTLITHTAPDTTTASYP